MTIGVSLITHGEGDPDRLVDDPEYRASYDALRARDADNERDAIDRGWHCPTCHNDEAGTIARKTCAINLPVFQCERCGEQWYDADTRPCYD